MSENQSYSVVETKWLSLLQTSAVGAKVQKK